MTVKLLKLAMAMGFIFTNLFSVALAGDNSSSSSKATKKSQSSMSKRQEVQSQPVITNEVEYAEFIRKNNESSEARKTRSSLNKNAETEKSSASQKN